MSTVLRRVMLGLAIIGLGVASYLTYVHYAGFGALVCVGGHAGHSSCETVQSSVWSKVGELFSIHAVCEWCVSSAVILTLLLIGSIVRYVIGGPPATRLTVPAGVSPNGASSQNGRTRGRVARPRA
jgi:uncharacterized membrane protein